MAACSEQINHILIGQHDQWFQDVHEKFLKQIKTTNKKQTVFDRINIYSKYHNLKQQFFNDIMSNTKTS